METKNLILKSYPASLEDLNLNPKDNGSNYQITCPNCGERQAYVYKNNNIIKCSRTNKCDYSISLWDYAQQTKHLDKQGILFYFADMAGVYLPKKESPQKDSTTETLERISSYFQAQLFSPSGSPTLNYLLNERKYTEDEIRSIKLGHYPSQKELEDFLKGEKINYADIADIIFTKGFGDTHKLVIPFKNEQGLLTGFICRTLKKETKDKYHNSKGLKPSELFFNIHNNKDEDTLIIVEGYLDALIAEARGLKGVITVGTSGISKTRLETLINYKVKNLVLALDNDNAGQSSTKKFVEMYLKEYVNKFNLFVFNYPKGTKDLDELMRTEKTSTTKLIISSLLEHKENKEENINYLCERFDIPKEEIKINLVKPLDIYIKDWLTFVENREGLLGYSLNKFENISTPLSGIQTGLYIIGADTNIGKTAFLTNLYLDLLETNKNLKGIYFTLDDSKEVILSRLVAIISDLEINTIKRKIAAEDKAEQRRQACYKLIGLIKGNRLDIKDISEVNKIETLEAIIKQKTDNLVVFIDGLYNLDVSSLKIGGIREENILRANKLKSMVDIYNIPIITTAETRKRNPNEKGELTGHDIMETGKYLYNANVVWLIEPENKDNFKDKDDVIFKLWFWKNKLSHFKGSMRFNFIRKKGIVEICNGCNEEEEGFYNKGDKKDGKPFIM